MPNRIWSGLLGQLEDARRALRDAPVEVALGWIAAIALSVTLELDRDLDELLRIAITAALSFPVAFAFSTLRAAGAVTPRVRWLGTAAGIAFAALYGFGLFDATLASEAWRAACLFGAAALLPALVPLRATRETDGSRAWFWLFDTRLAIRFVTVYGFAAFLALGLSLAVAAIGNLFELSVPDRLYGHVSGLVFLALAPWALAGGIPDLLAHPSDRELAARHARRAGLFLALPLLLVYCAILYGYAIKIAVTGEVPRNLVSPVVLGAGALWTLAAVALEPAFWEEQDRWHGVARLLRWLPPAMLPLLAIGGWAIWLRVDDYGWTEFRYVRMLAVAALAVVAISGTVRLLQRRRPPLRSLPIAAMAALLVASLGPASAPAVARRSQRQQLARALEDVGLRRPDGPPAQLYAFGAQPVDRRAVDADVYGRLTGSAHYLVTHFGADALDGLLEGDIEAVRGYDVGTALGLEPRLDHEQIRFVDAYLAPGTAIELANAETAYRFQVVGDSARFGDLFAEYVAPDRLLDIEVDGGRWHADLDSIFERLRELANSSAPVRPRPAGLQRLPPGNAELPADLAIIELIPEPGSSDSTFARLVIESIMFEIEPARGRARPRLALRRLDGLLLVDRPDR